MYKIKYFIIFLVILILFVIFASSRKRNRECMNANILPSGGGMNRGQSLTSINGTYSLLLDDDGILKLFNIGRSNPLKIWSTANKQTNKNGILLKFDTNEIYILNDVGDKIWTTGSNSISSSGTQLSLNDNGSVVVLDKNENAVYTIYDNSKTESFTGSYSPQQDGIYASNDIFAMQRELINEINDLNSSYVNYIHCNYNFNYAADTGTQNRPQLSTNGSCSNYISGSNFSNNTLQINDKNGNNLKTVTGVSSQKIADILKSNYTTANDLSDLRQKYTNLENDIEKYKQALLNMPLVSDPSLQPSVLNDKHNTIVNMRKDLDIKLNELNNSANSQFFDSKIHLDSTVYATLLWSTLATILVYITVVS